MKKYVLSNRVAGLGDCLFHLYFSWYIARRKNRTLVIDWCQSFYNCQGMEPLNAFLYFFQPLKDIEGVPVLIAPEKIRQEGNSLSSSPVFTGLISEARIEKARLFRETITYLNDLFNFFLIWPGGLSKAPVICSPPLFGMRYFRKNKQSPTLLKKFFSHLRPLEHIQRKIDQFEQDHFSGRKVIAVHIRTFPGTKKHDEQSMSRIVSAVKQKQRKFGEKTVIFLCTDNLVFVDQFMAVFPNSVFYKKEFPVPYKTNRSYYPDSFMLQYQKYKYMPQVYKIEYKKRLIEDTVVDMFLLAKSDVLICYPGSSGFTFYPRYCGGRCKEVVNIGKPWMRSLGKD